MSGYGGNDDWRYYLDKSYDRIVIPDRHSSAGTIEVIKAACGYCVSICVEQSWFDGASFDDLTAVVDNLGNDEYSQLMLSTIADIRKWRGGPMRVMYQVILNACKTTFEYTYRYDDVNRLSLAEIATFLTIYCNVQFSESTAYINEIIDVGYAK